MELKWIAEGGSQAGVAASVAAKRKNRERILIGALILCGLIAIAGVTGSILFSRKAESLRRVVRAQIGAPEHHSFNSVNISNHIVVSP